MPKALIWNHRDHVDATDIPMHYLLPDPSGGFGKSRVTRARGAERVESSDWKCHGTPDFVGPRCAGVEILHQRDIDRRLFRSAGPEREVDARDRRERAAETVSGDEDRTSVLATSAREV
jgi:hypothetical protein